MVANAVITSQNVVRAVDLEPKFFGTDGKKTSFPMASTTKVTLQLGAEPSESRSEIKLAADVYERAPTLTALTTSPAYSFLAHNMPMIVRKWVRDSNSADTVTRDAVQPLFAGVITEINQTLARDMIVVVARDLRYRLNKIQVQGSFWAEGSLSSGSFSIQYRQAEPFVCNPDGRPNKLYANHVTYGKVPVMCVPDFGVDTSGTIASAEYTKASYWTAKDILLALWLMCDASFSATAKVYFPWYKTKPDDLTWDRKYASVLDQPTDYDPGNRKQKEYRLDGGRVCSLIQDVLTNAGGYSLYCAPTSSKNPKQELKIVRNNYFAKPGTEQKELPGITLARPKSGSFCRDGRIVTGGEINERSDELYTRVVVAGQPTMIERRIDQETSGGNNALETRWTADDLAAMTTYINSKLSAGADFKRIIQEAFAFYPQVGAAFGLKPSYNFATGTSEETLGPLAQVPRPILPHLLESYKQSSSSDTMSTLAAYRRPVIVEYYNGSIWLPAGFADGLQIESNGTFWLTGLRDQFKTLKFTRLTVNTCSITAYKLRMTVAIPCDRRVKYDADGLQKPEIPNDFNRLFAAGADGDTLFIDAGDLYRKEIQRESWPIPEVVTGATKKGDSAERVLANDAGILATFDNETAFYDLPAAPLRAHAEARLADVAKLRRSGGLMMPYIHQHIEPGTAIKSLNNLDSGVSSGEYPIQAVVHRVIISNEDGRQYQYLELSP